ncbi:MAG: hypothetical protein ACREIA_13995 [Opitutaceae bacterium]
MNRSWPAPLGKKNIRLLPTINDSANSFETSRRSSTGASLRRFPRSQTQAGRIESHAPWWLRGNDGPDFTPPEAA